MLSTYRTQTALGTILNGVLGRMLDEIIGLQDITTKESARLNEACRMIHPLEELFVDQPGQVSPEFCINVSASGQGRHSVADCLLSLTLLSRPQWSRSCRYGSSSATSPSCSYVSDMPLLLV